MFVLHFDVFILLFVKYTYLICNISLTLND